MQISPKLNLAFKILLVIVSVFAAGSAYKPSFVSAWLATDIQGMSATALLILTSIYSLLVPEGANPVLTGAPPARTLCVAIFGCLLTAMLLSALQSGQAEAAPRRAAFPPIPPKRPSGDLFNGGLQTPDQLVDKIRLWATSDGGADLDAAIGVGIAAKNNVTVPCFQAIRGFVTLVQGLPTADKLPKIHLAVDIEILTDLEIALLPNSPIITSCTALANFQAVSAQNLVTGIVSGALALSKFAPVIPPI